MVVRRVPLTGGEMESLRASLDRHRDVVLWKIDGVGDAELRRPMTPSGTNLLGMVEHLAAVECRVLRPGPGCRRSGRRGARARCPRHVVVR